MTYKHSFPRNLDNVQALPAWHRRRRGLGARTPRICSDYHELLARRLPHLLFSSGEDRRRRAGRASGERGSVDFGMRAAAAARADMYELEGGIDRPEAGGLRFSRGYAWPLVKDRANLHGHAAIAVPGRRRVWRRFRLTEQDSFGHGAP